MITRIRQVRQARGLTLADVAARCDPPTTAQTVGRLETGTRTVSVGWLNRIAAALGVAAADLVQLPDQAELAVVAVLGPDGADAPVRAQVALPPRPDPDEVALLIESGRGDYRRGDVAWCRRLPPDRFGEALNRDVLVPRRAGRFLFGRLLAREGARLHLLPLDPGARQQVIEAAPWLAVATRLVRTLG